MMVDVKPNGKPYIQGKIKDVSQIICLIFDDEKANRFHKPLFKPTFHLIAPTKTLIMTSKLDFSPIL